VADCPGVELIDLSTVRQHVPTGDQTEIDRAQTMVAQAVKDYAQVLRARARDEEIAQAVAATDRLIAQQVSQAIADHQAASGAQPDQAVVERITHQIRKKERARLHQQILHIRQAGAPTDQ
jgi:glutamyl-tRNA reductase